MTEDLAELARAAGVVGTWVDAAGYRHVVPDESLCLVLEAMELPCRSPRQRSRSASMLEERRRQAPPILTTWVGSPTRLSFALPSPAPFRIRYEDGAVVEGHVFEGEGGHWLPPLLHAGYHQLEVAGSQIRLAVAPLRACTPVEHQTSHRRPWGISLRGGQPLDFTCLANLARGAAGHGADALAVGSLHDDQLADQRWLDPARIDPSAALSSNAPTNAANTDSMSRLREFYQVGLPRDELLLREFLRFDRDGDGTLEAFARFRAAHEAGSGAQDGAVVSVDSSQAEAVGFQMFLQWLAQRGRASAQAAARAAGMSIGLVADFELTGHVTSSDASSDPRLLLGGVRSDDPKASDLDLSQIPYSPAALAEQGLQPFIDVLRANMHGVGGLRIQRFDRWWQHWVQPNDAPARSGAYLEFPFEDLLRLLVLESVRHQCIVIVDHADALPERLRDAIDQAGVLRTTSIMAAALGEHPESSTERIADDEKLAAVVSSSQPDQPTLLAWWRGDDLQQAGDEGEATIMAATRELGQREQARRSLLASLGIERRSGGRQPARDRRDPLRSMNSTRRAVAPEPYEQKIIDALMHRLGSMAAELVLVDLDDLFGQPTGATLARTDRDSVGRLLDTTRVRARLNRLDDQRRSPPQNRSIRSEHIRTA